MKKIICSVILLLVGSIGWASLITRTYTYTAGNTITANENNTNENTLYTEINGNLNSANIATGGITSTNILDGTIVFADMATTVISSMTAVQNMASFRRANLVWVSTNTVNIENNVDTSSNTSCVIFPDTERRCVTEDLTLTQKYRRASFLLTANFTTGTEASGMRSGLTLSNNSAYAVYAVKSQINSANFVMVIDDGFPTQTNNSTFVSRYGTNGFVFLGYIRNGDGPNTPTGMLKFVQNGNRTSFTNVNAGGSAINSTGIMVSSSAGATSLTYTYAASNNTPSTITHVSYVASNNSAGAVTLTDSAAAITLGRQTGGVLDKYTAYLTLPASLGLKLTNGSSVACDIYITEWIDGALGGIAPQL